LTTRAAKGVDASDVAHRTGAARPRPGRNRWGSGWSSRRWGQRRPGRRVRLRRRVLVWVVRRRSWGIVSAGFVHHVGRDFELQCGPPFCHWT
jgi:hypothetical protein